MRYSFRQTCSSSTWILTSVLLLIVLFNFSISSTKILLHSACSSSPNKEKTRGATGSDLVVDQQEMKRPRQSLLRANDSPTKQHEEASYGRPMCQVHEHSTEYTKGRWVYNQSKVSYPYLGGEDYEWGPMCTDMEKEYLHTGKIPDFLKYQWQPDECDLARWDRNDFCQRMAGKTIGLIGDSMMQQFAHSLMGLALALEGGTIQNKGHFIPPDYKRMMVSLCPDTSHDVTMLFVRWNQYKAEQEEDRRVLADLATHSDYLVMNWGVHYQPWKEMEAATMDFMKVLLQYWRDKPFERIFWRSTIVAHANCSTATEPEEWGKDVSFHDNPTYNTDEIMLQDKQIVQPLFRYPPNTDVANKNDNRSEQGAALPREDWRRLKEVTLFRVESSTLLRRDGHRVIGHHGTQDCLHYCEPGPTDHWIELFYHHIFMGI